MMFLVLMVVPMFACTIFTSYTIPLEVDGFGYSSTVISALLLSSYMISAYAGPFMTKTILSKFRPIRATYIYCIGVALMIFAFTVVHTFPLLVFVMLALGLLDSFGTSVMTEAYTGFSESSESTVGSLYIYILVTRVGMTVAPTIILIFGSSLALSGFVIIGMALFLLFGTVANILHGKEKQS